MHVLQFLKLGHAAPPGRRLNFSKNTEFDDSDLDMCGLRFYRNYRAEFNETWYNYSMEGVVEARSSIFKLGHAAPPGGRLHFSKNTEFDCSDFYMCG